MATSTAGRERTIIDTFVELADTMASDYDITEFMQRLVERCAEVLGADVAGVMLESPAGTLQLSAATSDAMGQIERVEVSSGTGPCADAYRTGEQVVAEDLADFTHRWPQVVPQLQDLGMRAGYAFPLRLRDDRIGALNLYRTTPGRFDDDDVRVGQAFADVAAIGILQQRALADSQQRRAQLEHALDSRIAVEQAKGVLVDRHGVTPQDAFEAIRSYARDHRRTVREVSEQVVAEAIDVRP